MYGVALMRPGIRVLLLASLLATIPTVAPSKLRAQSTAAQPPSEELTRANALLTAGDWKGTLAAYESLAQKYPSHPLSRFRVGVALIGLGRFAEAEANLGEGERLGIPAAQGAFRLAQALAEQGKSDAAIAELFRSAAARLPLAPSALESDAHFAKLKSHPKWTAAMNAIDAVSHPCMHDPRAREFDFWVGDWDVRPTGTPPTGPASRNNITLEDDGCIVMEHYTTPTPYIGQSFNLFDHSLGLWRQTWVDNTGGQHDYRGSLKNGNLEFIGDTPAPNGALGRIPTKLTLFHISKDSVRQFSQVSADSGKTWTTAYDLMYVRRRP
jgi:tetratricopeptide (TPR) repeat protein